MIKVFPPGTLDKDLIAEWLVSIDHLLVYPLSQRIDINDYSEKLSHKATNVVYLINGSIIGCVSIYLNKDDYSYIPIVGVLKEYQGKGIAKNILFEAIKEAFKTESKGIKLECATSLIGFYNKLGFERIDSFEYGCDIKVHMLYNINSCPHYPFQETNIIRLDSSSQKYGVNLYMKRDDTFSLAQGGNKARKLQYILYKAKLEGYDAVVTAGDINSNHNRATALMCASLNMECHLIVHNDNPSLSDSSLNSFMCKICGANTSYCSKQDVSKTMDMAMDDFRKEGKKPFYIWGGGHCLEGSYAYFEAARYVIHNNDIHFDQVFFTSGTGTTHAGIHAGFKLFSPSTLVTGISIAREKERGAKEIHKSLIQLQDFLKLPYSSIDEIDFNDKYIGAGYESIELKVGRIIREIASSEGILLDPTYTGKSFNAMIDIITKNAELYNNKNILFWNTGGIFNLLSHRTEI